MFSISPRKPVPSSVAAHSGVLVPQARCDSVPDRPAAPIAKNLIDPFNDAAITDVVLPSGLESLTFGVLFNQSMENVALPRVAELGIQLGFQPEHGKCGFA